MSWSFSVSSTPSATPPSSPELNFCPPAILQRSAEVRAAIRSLFDDEYCSSCEGGDRDPPPASSPHAMELPLNVYTGAPTDEECGLPPLVEVALSNIDAVSEPLVSWLRTAPPLTVIVDQTRRTMARVLAHYLNVRRSEERAGCVLLVSRTDRTARAWEDALVPLLDHTLDFLVTNFFTAKSKRKEALKNVEKLRRPGLIIASEKGLRTPEVEPGITCLGAAVGRNPHGIKWDLVVSDIVRPDDLHDDISPLRILANHQTEQALVVLCQDDVINKKTQSVVSKRQVDHFVGQHLVRFGKEDRDIERVWCTPEKLKKRNMSEAAYDEDDAPTMKGGNGSRSSGSGPGIMSSREKKIRSSSKSRERDLNSRPVAMDSEMEKDDNVTPRKVGRDRQIKRVASARRVGRDAEIETELDKLHISAAASNEQRPKVNKTSAGALEAMPERAHLDPEMDTKLDTLPSSAAASNAQLRTRLNETTARDLEAMPRKVRLDPEVGNFRTSATASKEQRPGTHNVSTKHLGTKSESEQRWRVNETTLPGMRQPSVRVREEPHARPVVEGPKQNQAFLGNAALRCPTRGLPSSGSRKFIQGSSSLQVREGNSVTVMEDSDGEEELFYDTQPWIRTPPKAEACREGNGHRRPARRRKSGSKVGAAKKGNFPPSRTATSQPSGPLLSSPSPTICMKQDSGGGKMQKPSREELLSLFGDGKTTAVPLSVRSMGDNAERRPVNGRRTSLSLAGAISPSHAKIKEEKEHNAYGHAKSSNSRLHASSGRSSELQYSGQDVNGGAVERKDRRRKKYKPSSGTGVGPPVAARGSHASSPLSSGRSRSLKITSPNPDRPKLGSTAAKPRKSLTPQPTPPASSDEVVLVVDLPDTVDKSAPRKIDNEVWVISSDDDKPRSPIQDGLDRSRNAPMTNPKAQVRQSRSDKSRRTPSNLSILTGVTKLRPDLNTLPSGDRRKFNRMVARAREAEGKGPKGFSEALQLYLQALDIYDGDDFLTSRILALSTVTHAWDDAKLPRWALPISRSLPIMKPRHKRESNGRQRRLRGEHQRRLSGERPLRGEHGRRLSGERPLSCSTNSTTNFPAVSRRRHSFEGEVIVIED